MMNSLFSSFDPLGGMFKMNYAPLILFMCTPIYMKFTNLSRNMFFKNQMKMNLMTELNSVVTNKFKKNKMNILISMFIMILMMNLLGLFPYIFTLTAHMMFTLSLALPFWLGFIIFSLTSNTNHFFSHLVPLSTPLALSQFMVMIETISQIIRPITLSVRLAANMTAGHILMALASSNIIMLNLSSGVLIILLILETAVAFIQSYVFTILLTMYLNEA